MQKRGPLPIFNRGKRPKLALLAHPNKILNQQPPQHPQYSPAPQKPAEPLHYTPQPPAANSRSSYQNNIQNVPPPKYGVSAPSSSYGASPSMYKSTAKSFTPPTQQQYKPAVYAPSVHQSFAHTQPQFKPAYAPPIPQSSQPSAYAPPIPQSSQPSAYAPPIPQSSQPSAYAPPIPRSSQPLAYAPPIPPSPTQPPSTMMYHQKQAAPAKSWSIKTEEDSPSKKSYTRRPTHMLTATAQGVQHWAQYSSLAHLLFEVYGTVDSQVSVGNFGAKQFIVRTNDGQLKCCFWEIDRPLPHLVRGHAYRVVGTWDTKHRYLKCVSVRQSQPSEEEQWIRLAIQASDRAMRQLAATQNEQ